MHLDVPSLHVGEVSIDVERLEAHLALRAQLANLVNLVAGAHVGVEKVRIEIKDVDAEATLKVRLDNTYNIFDRTLTTLDENPELIKHLPPIDLRGQVTPEPAGAAGDESDASDDVGDLSDAVGDTLSSVADKANPKRLLRGGSKRSSREHEESVGEPEHRVATACRRAANPKCREGDPAWPRALRRPES